MKSTISLIVAGMASTVVAQPHGHGHAHQHPARVNHQHQHAHDKRYLKTEWEVVWVTETVTEVIDGTATEYFTAGPTAPATTLATVTTSSSASSSSSTSAGEFFEGATTSSTSSIQSTPSYSSSSSSSTSTSIYVAPTPTTTYEAPAPTTTYEAPAPTTTSEVPVAEPTTTSSTEVAATATTAEAEAAATVASSSSDSSSVTGSNFSGKITWIGDTTGAYSACGAPYESGSMYVAVNPDVLDCGSGTGSKMSVTANGKTVTAYAIDKCMGCDTSHIDVATAVYEALGYNTGDGGMHDTSGISWIISQI